MKQEDDDHQADDDRFFDQVALQRVDRCIDQPGAVVTGDDLPLPAGSDGLNLVRASS